MIRPLATTALASLLALSAGAQDSSDLRFRYYRLSTQGKKEVRALDERLDAVLVQQQQHLRAAQLKKLAKYLE